MPRFRARSMPYSGSLGSLVTPTSSVFNIAQGAVSWWTQITGFLDRTAFPNPALLHLGSDFGHRVSVFVGINSVTTVGQLSIAFGSPTTTIAALQSSTVRPKEGGWFHFLVTWSASGLVLYANAVSALSSALDCTMSHAATPWLSFAKDYAGSLGVPGLYTDARVYGSPVTSLAQVQDLYYRDIDPSTPIVRYGFTEGTGTAVSPTSGSAVLTAPSGVLSGDWSDQVPIRARQLGSGRAAVSGRAAIASRVTP